MQNSVSAVTNLFDYFQGQVERAQRDSAVELSPDTSLYLASLLTDRARADRPQLPGSETLAELHASAAHAPPAARARTYRELGDRALYLVGWFRGSVARKVVGVSYYEDMGAAAYHQVDAVFKCWFADAFGPVFTELADGFRQCVHLLERIRSIQDDRPDAVGRLYAKWLATGNDEAAERLRSLGLLIPRTPTREH